MATVPPEEHILFSKLDLADGFWRMIVEPDERWNFCYVMPTMPGTPIQLVIPGALQMGWTESPAFFCATTETVRDVAQFWIDDPNLDIEPHVFEKYVEANVAARHQTSSGPQHQMSVVYVDDFLLLAWRMPRGPYYKKRRGRRSMLFIASFPRPLPRGCQMPKIQFLPRS